MKLFVISDIHGCLPAFEKSLSLFEKEGADYMVICGDYLNHGPRNDIPEGYDTKALAALLNQHKERIIGVRGNCDSEVDQMMLEFPVMAPISQIMLPDGARVFIHHGHLYTYEDAAGLNNDGTIIVSGHTHIPVLEKRTIDNKEFVFMNPGSVSIPKGGSQPGYGVIDTVKNEIKLCTFTGMVLECYYR